jgi:multisubunit Na+/H+ antiporter MnhB subunit
MTDWLWLGFDAVQVIALWVLGWLACSSRDVRRAITLFIAFGLLLALTWARLSAPDLALAEAAIGAGISGALLLAASRDQVAQSGPSSAQPLILRGLINLLSLGLFVLLGLALWYGIPQPRNELMLEVQAMLPDSGVSNPVTAVLLNFRAYDTLLELAVVLSAVMAIVALGPMRPTVAPAGFLLSGLTRWLTPMLVTVAGYLLWVGSHAPGGAFQAGAVLASALILLLLSRLPNQPAINAGLLRGLLVLGIAVFVGVGLVSMLFNQHFLAYFPGTDGGLILLIETAATLSIAAALTLAYAGGHPADWDRFENRQLPDSAGENA